MVMGSPLTIFVSHAVEALLDSHHILYLLADCLLMKSFANHLYNSFLLW